MAPKVFREFSGPKTRERWPLEYDLEGIERDTKTRAQLEEQQKQQSQNEAAMTNRAQSSNFFVGGASIDLNRPPKEAYRHQEYPKMLYHQTKKDPNWLAEHKRITLYNSLHPEKPELLPTVPAAFIQVNSKEEEEAALKRGFQLKPPPDPSAKAEEEAMDSGETLCSRGCGNPPHRGSCKPVAAAV